MSTNSEPEEPTETDPDPDLDNEGGEDRSTAKVSKSAADPNNAVLADPSTGTDSDSWTIHGVALKDGELTHGQNGSKLWPGEELSKAADSLAGNTVTTREGINGISIGGALEETNHGQRVPVGQITRSAYDPDHGVVVYDMEVENEDIASALALGDLEISIEASNPSEIDEDPETGAAIMRDYEFSGMDVVGKGAARSNHTAAGSAADNPAIAALSAEDVNNMLDKNDAEEAALDASIHTPSYSGTSTSSPSWADGSWERPSKGQFDTDDLSDIADHFIASTTGFSSPDQYSDLKLPVVEPSGTLNLNGLRAANNRLSQTSGLSDSDKSSARTKIQNLAENQFDESLGSDEEAANEAADASEDEDSDTDTTDDPDAETGEAGADEDESDDESESEAAAEAADDDPEDSDEHTDVKTSDNGETDSPESDSVTDGESSEDTDQSDGRNGDDPGENPASSSEDADPEPESESESESTPTDSPADDTPSDGDDGTEPEGEGESEDTNENANEADETSDADGEGGDVEDGQNDSGRDDVAANQQTQMSKAESTPDDEESTETETNTENADGNQEQTSGTDTNTDVDIGDTDGADFDLDGKVVIDEGRHDELKAKADMAAALESELDETMQKLDVRENQIDTVHNVYAAALAEKGPHSEEFYQQNDLEVLIEELQNATGAESEQAALEETVNEDQQALPQTGDQQAEDPEGEAALEEAEQNAEAALRLDDTAALARSDKTARQYVQDKYGHDPTEFDSDVELRDTIYGENGLQAGGDN